jgi:hypothetical protein
LKDDALSVSSPAEIGGDGLKVADTSVYVFNKARLAIYKGERDATQVDARGEGPADGRRLAGSRRSSPMRLTGAPRSSHEMANGDTGPPVSSAA